MDFTDNELEAASGDTIQTTIQVNQPGTTTAQDLTGADCFFAIRTDPDSAALVQLESAGTLGIAVPTPSNGQANVTVPSSECADLPVDLVLYCDLRVTLPNGTSFTAWRGILIVRPAMAGTTPADISSMSSNFTPAFIGLLGGAPALASVNATAADIGKILQGLDGNNALVSYRVAAGTDASNSPGIIRPANFDATSNQVVFVAC